MFFSLILRRGLNRRYKGDMYAYRVRYLVICLVMAAIFIIAASVLLGVFGTSSYTYIILYVYGGLELIVALIVYCKLQNMKNQPQ
jgi:hypothetical protein